MVEFDNSVIKQQLVESIDHVYIQEKSVGSRVAKRFYASFPQDKISVVKDHPYAKINGELSSEEFNNSKKNVFITEFKGAFFKRCPGARPGLTCCNYFVLNLGLQCNMNCSYCYLQSFINTPIMTVYSNIDEALAELKVIADENPNMPFRVGTGEVIDSLSLDPITEYSRDLIEFFNAYPNWRLEFKTKSHYVEQFLDAEHNKNTIVSWSINPQYIVDQEEHGTSSLAARLEAAQKCIEKGYQIAFHIDPVIWHPEWKQNYKSLVNEITKRFTPEQIPYFSLGALRFQPEQRHMMKERFGVKSLVNQGEMFKGTDGKLRYDQSLRKEMFDYILSEFKAHSSRWKIFLCMESPETWLKTMDMMPKSVDGLEELFDHNVTRAFKKTAAQNENTTSCK